MISEKRRRNKFFLNIPLEHTLLVDLISSCTCGMTKVNFIKLVQKHNRKSCFPPTETIRKILRWRLEQTEINIQTVSESHSVSILFLSTIA